MKSLRAHVEKGRIIVDDTTDLPDGTVLRLLPVKVFDDVDDMGESERAEFLRALHEGIENETHGEMEDAIALADRLLAKP